jgi:hypothetical protein
MPNTVRLHRVLATRPEKVYRAFLEAERSRNGCRPMAFPVPHHHLEPKVGGTFKIRRVNLGGRFLASHSNAVERRQSFCCEIVINRKKVCRTRSDGISSREVDGAVTSGGWQRRLASTKP